MAIVLENPSNLPTVATDKPTKYSLNFDMFLENTDLKMIWLNTLWSGVYLIKKIIRCIFLSNPKKRCIFAFVVATLVSSFLDGTCSFNGVRYGINKYSVIGFADSREGNEVELKMRIVNLEWERKKER